ncbi:MAG: DUF4397 domain-containing protein [Bryocella sp.]
MAVRERQPGFGWSVRGTRAVAALLTAGAMMGALSGCQSIESTNANVAEIRFINASPDFYNPGLDFFINGTGSLYNVGYPTYSSYVPITAGTYTLSVGADGSTPKQTLQSTKATLLSGHTYSYVVGSLLANLSGTVLQDQTQIAPSGQISLRFVDQNDVIGAVDVYAIPAGGTLLTTKPLLQSVNFGEVRGYLAIPTNTYTLVVLPANTQPVANTVAIYNGGPVGYTAGQVLTLFITDQQLTTTPGLNIFSVVDVPGI